MAIDTAAKRMSMHSVNLPIAWSLHPIIDGSITLADQSTLLGLYGGIVLGAPAVFPDFMQFINTLLTQAGVTDSSKLLTQAGVNDTLLRSL